MEMNGWDKPLSVVWMEETGPLGKGIAIIICLGSP